MFSVKKKYVFMSILVILILIFIIKNEVITPTIANDSVVEDLSVNNKFVIAEELIDFLRN